MTAVNFQKWGRAAGDWVKRFATARALILMYHRVAEPERDPWGLAVSPQRFEEQMAILKKYAQPMRLGELIQQLRSGRCPERAVAVTFDDGYADNLYQAKPVLDRYQIPATVFIATDYIRQERPFWWDTLEDICFQPQQLPKTLTWPLGRKKTIDLRQAAADRTSGAGVFPWEAAPGTRLHFFYTVWEKLLRLPVAQREDALRQLADWSGHPPKQPADRRPLRPEELPALESSGWVETGAHTLSHAALSAHSRARQTEEIAKSKSYLEGLLRHPVCTFSYPYGDYSRTTVALVKALGFIGACTTQESVIWKRSCPHRLPRRNVLNWKGETFKNRILSQL